MFLAAKGLLRDDTVTGNVSKVPAFSFFWVVHRGRVYRKI
jgi:hypothetical protein